jgi:hypothetical protein
MSAGGVLLKTSMTKLDSQPGRLCRADSAATLCDRPNSRSQDIRMRRVVLQLLALAVLATLPRLAESQSLSLSADASGAAASVTAGKLEPTYVRPTQALKLRNYAFDAFGPYPLAGSAVSAGINQYGNEPPEWDQSVDGYFRRFGSNVGIAVIGTTTRYALSQALREDSLYYRCECKGVLPRAGHAVLSTITARRGADGHRVFSFPALIAPYAGTFTAVYGWYPDRFGAKDAFRMGNYTLLGSMGANFALEFLYSGPHSLLTRLHLNNTHGSPDPGPNH